MANAFSGSPEVGGRDRDRKRATPEVVEDRPRAGASLGEGPENEPVVNPRGLLDQAQSAIEESPVLGSPRGGREIESGGDRDRPLAPPPREEVVPPLLPGDPNDLGARGRRRRREDEDFSSPVLRRGLLGV